MPEMQSVNVNLAIYSLGTRSTIDKPEYKFNSLHEFVMETQAFDSLRRLHEELIQHTPAGFLRSQFFRVALAKNFKFCNFIDSDAKLRYQLNFEDLENNKLDLVLVRYTKPQTHQLKEKVTPDELLILDSVLRYKRKYNRIVAPVEKKSCDFRRAQYAAVVSDLYNIRPSLAGVCSELASLTDLSGPQCECAARCVVGSSAGLAGVVYARQVRGVAFNESCFTGYAMARMEVPADMVPTVYRFIGERMLAAQGYRINGSTFSEKRGAK